MNLWRYLPNRWFVRLNLTNTKIDQRHYNQNSVAGLPFSKKNLKYKAGQPTRNLNFTTNKKRVTKKFVNTTQSTHANILNTGHRLRNPTKRALKHLPKHILWPVLFKGNLWPPTFWPATNTIILRDTKSVHPTAPQPSSNSSIYTKASKLDLKALHCTRGAFHCRYLVLSLVRTLNCKNNSNEPEAGGQRTFAWRQWFKNRIKVLHACGLHHFGYPKACTVP